MRRPPGALLNVSWVSSVDSIRLSVGRPTFGELPGADAAWHPAGSHGPSEPGIRASRTQPVDLNAHDLSDYYRPGRTMIHCIGFVQAIGLKWWVQVVKGSSLSRSSIAINSIRQAAYYRYLYIRLW